MHLRFDYYAAFYYKWHQTNYLLPALHVWLIQTGLLFAHKTITDLQFMPKQIFCCYALCNLAEHLQPEPVVWFLSHDILLGLNEEIWQQYGMIL